MKLERSSKLMLEEKMLKREKDSYNRMQSSRIGPQKQKQKPHPRFLRLVTQALTLAALERAHHPVLSEEQQQCGLQSSSTISSASVIFSLNLRFIKFMILEPTKLDNLCAV